MTPKKILASAAAVATAIGLALAIPQGGASAAAPGFEPDANVQGSLTFYNAAGAVVTGGSSLTHLFDYAVASTPTDRGTTKATLFFAFPDHTKADSSTWAAAAGSASTTFPNAAAPAPINATANPTVSLGATDGNLAGPLGSATLDTTAGYANIVQVRVKDSGAGIGKGILAKPFWATDIQINTAAGTWTQVYPVPVAAAVATVSTPVASPVSPAAHGSTVTLTSTVSATDSSHPAGSVHLFDGATDKGAVTFTAATGAISASDTPTDGAHSYKFVFTPTSTAAYNGSSSGIVAYTVNPAAPVQVTTSVSTPVASPVSPAAHGSTVTLTSTVSATDASHPAGSVHLFDGATDKGAVTFTAATGAISASDTPTDGAHSYKFAFTPTNTAGYTAATSGIVAYTVNPAAPTQVTTTVWTPVASPVSPAAHGSTVTLTSTVSATDASHPAGSVHLFDGATDKGAVTFTAVTGSVAATDTPADGAHSYKFVFTPTNTAGYTGSSSATLAYTVNPAAPVQVTTTVSLPVANPVSPAAHGSTVTLTATVSATDASHPAGSVHLFDGATDKGPVTFIAANGPVSATDTPADGAHSYKFAFTPTNTAGYTPSTSGVLVYSVNPAVPAQLTTSVSTPAASPVSPAAHGSTVTLTATVSATDSSRPAGSVHLFDGATDKGAVTFVAANGAVSATDIPADGAHSYKFVFTPTDTAAYGGSSSAALAYTISSASITPVVTLSTTPAGPINQNAAVTLNVNVNPAGVTGTVQFSDGPTAIGAPVPVSGGAAHLPTTFSALGLHSITAKFSSSNPALYTDATSSALSLIVNPVTTQCPASAPKVDVTVATDLTKASNRIKSHGVTTSRGGELVLAFIEIDGPTAPTQRVTSVKGGGLHWSLAVRSNETWGSTEVWQAWAPKRLKSAHVTARFAKSGFDGSMTVTAFSGAAQQVGTTKASAGTDGHPTSTITPSSCNSLIWTAAHDWTMSATPRPVRGQSLVHSFIDNRVMDSYWTQRLDLPTKAATPVTIEDNGLGFGRWTMATVEIPPAPTGEAFNN